MNKGKFSMKFGPLFAASNSADGFKSYYDSVFDRRRLKHLYIIKGGPGTGKSSFMRDIGEYFESACKNVEYYMCSSDPDSIDGIIIDSAIAVVDGTAPHTMELEIAGARDDIVDLGAFWDSRGLSDKYDDIAELCKRKGEAYNIGYRYLSACGAIAKIDVDRAHGALKAEKMRAYISRVLGGGALGREYDMHVGLVDSVGMKGRVRYETFERRAAHIYEISDIFSSGSLFLSELILKAKEYKCSVCVSYDPINPELPNAVFICDSEAAFVIKDTNRGDESVPPNVTRVNMMRFLDKEITDALKKEYKQNRALRKSLLDLSCAEFARAGKYHFELEKIYMESMDFSAKERFTRSFCEMLYDLYFKGE